MYDEVKRLQSFSDKNETIVHYLEPSIRAPKNFATNPGNSSWAQCLLQLKFNNRDVYPVKGSKSAEELTSQLWGLHGKKFYTFFWVLRFRILSVQILT